ncbi:MAG: hypothetical protein AAGL49_09050, partial [Pseudomonadota bacterium]
TDPSAIFHYDASEAAFLTEAGGAVSELRHLGAHARPAGQLTASSQPTLSGGVISFDGSNDYLDGRQSPSATFVGGVKVPDAQGGDVGEGFTNTGLARAADGTWWVGNDGRDKASGGSGLQTASLVRLSADFTTKLDEIDIETLVPATGSIQGVVVDPLDGSLWYVSLAERLVRHVTTAGVLLPADSISFGFDINGLAIDPLKRRLWVHSFGGTNVREVDIATKAVVRTMGPFHVQGDQLWYEPSLQRLWQSCDDAKVRVWDVSEALGSTPRLIATYDTPEADQIEGVFLVGDKMYLCNDAYFHGGSPAENRILEFDVVRVHEGAPTTDKAFFYGVFDRPGTQSTTTTALLIFGEPVDSPGAGIYFVQGSTQMRLIVNSASGSSERDILDWATDTTTEQIFTLEIDYSAATAALYENGTMVGSVRSLANLAAIPSLYDFIIAWSNDGAITPRFANAQIKVLGAASSFSNRQKVEGALAWKHGLTGLLPGGHRYKTAPPAA